MHTKRGIGDLGFTTKQQHRYHQQFNGTQEQRAGDGVFVEIGRNHGCQRQHKSPFLRSRSDWRRVSAIDSSNAFKSLPSNGRRLVGLKGSCRQLTCNPAAETSDCPAKGVTGRRLNLVWQKMRAA